MEATFAKLFQRQLKELVDQKDVTGNVLPSPREHLYFRNCINCTYTVGGPPMKVTIENCRSLKVEFHDKINSGMLEIITSRGVTLTISSEYKLPTIDIDRSKNIHLNLHQPQNVGIIHSVGVEDVFVHFDSPHMSEQRLEHPPGEDGEFLTRVSVGKLYTERCIREGGGYLTTVREKEAADKKQAEFDQKMTEMVTQMILKEKEQKSKPTQPTQPLPSKDEEQVTPPKNTPTPVDDSTPLSEALQKGKQNLKHAETVEKNKPVVGVPGGRGSGRNQYNIFSDEEKKEHFDNEVELNKKVQQVARWIKSSKHPIMFTGAGISTSAGIPDFRSGMNTVLPTGPGVWELRAEGSGRAEGSKITPILQALPTTTHMSIVKLHEAGLCKFTVSQNVDGLHRKSGLSSDQISELHGNTNLEICKKCNRQYLRDFETREAFHVFDHTTSRKCDDPDCRGQLKDSIINFGENLPEIELRKAFDHAQKADLCVVLGSSLRVRPACQVPEVVLANGGKVVIVNLQRIPQFPPNNRTLPVYAMCDTFMKSLMDELQIDIPKFILRRRVKVTNQTKGDQLEVTVTGIDVDEDVPYSFIMAVSISDDDIVTREPYVFTVPSSCDGDEMELTLEFQGHYGEGPMTLKYTPTDMTCVYWLGYDVMERAWHHMVKKNQ